VDPGEPTASLIKISCPTRTFRQGQPSEVIHTVCPLIRNCFAGVVRPVLGQLSCYIILFHADSGYSSTDSGKRPDKSSVASLTPRCLVMHQSHVPANTWPILTRSPYHLYERGNSKLHPHLLVVKRKFFFRNKTYQFHLASTPT
jgi:hypothetical protein